MRGRLSWDGGAVGGGWVCVGVLRVRRGWLGKAGWETRRAAYVHPTSSFVHVVSRACGNNVLGNISSFLCGMGPQGEDFQHELISHDKHESERTICPKIRGSYNSKAWW